MELVHDFTVPVPAEQAWALLQNIDEIAPCLPGAVVTSVDGDSFEGGMKIKVGPIEMTFKGSGAFIEKNEAEHRAVLEAKGRDARGNGGVQATVTATLEERDGVTDVNVATDLNVSGKAAQFGSGVMKDFSKKTLDQFASNLARLIESGGAQIDTSGVSDNGSVSSLASSSETAEQESIPHSQSTPAFVPDDKSIDALGLLLGSDSLQKTVKPLLIFVGGSLVGYLYGKNRTLERMFEHD